MNTLSGHNIPKIDHLDSKQLVCGRFQSKATAEILLNTFIKGIEGIWGIV